MILDWTETQIPPSNDFGRKGELKYAGWKTLCNVHNRALNCLLISERIYLKNVEYKAIRNSFCYEN